MSLFNNKSKRPLFACLVGLVFALGNAAFLYYGQDDLTSPNQVALKKTTPESSLPHFWFLKEGVEPTSENRIKAIQDTGMSLLDFAIFQPLDDSGKPLNPFSEEYRQKLLDAGFVFDFISEQQLAETDYRWASYHNSPIGRVSILVIPEGVSLPMEEMRRLKYLKIAFLGKVPEISESVPLSEKEKQRLDYLGKDYLDKYRKNINKMSFADWKKEIETRKTEGQTMAIAPTLPKEASPSVPVTPPSPNVQNCSIMDQIGDHLAEAVGLFFDRARTFTESVVAETGVKLLARRGLVPGDTKDGDAIDVFYVFANTKENAKPIDGWFRLQELSHGRMTGHVSYADGSDRMFVAEDDRAFLMDPMTGEIGKTSVRQNPDTNVMEIRIQMQPGQTLIIRIVRERWGKVFDQLGFQEFESLPDWEYKETAN